MKQKRKPKEYTVTQYADKIGIARQNVLKQISKGKLIAKKTGNQWIITA